MSRVGVGIIGAGNISDQYLTNLTQFADVEVLMVADLILERAASQAEKYGVPASGTVEQLLARDDIQIVVNITIPAEHAKVGQQIIAAGKHTWSEKPVATNAEDAQALLAAAEAAGVRYSTAPDTVLGAGIQTAIRAIARGDIGTPLTATTMFHVPGPDQWHPDPEFLYAQGAGPLFDIGPYYVTTLLHAFGSASRVQAVSSKSRETRVIGSGPRAGTEFAVEVPTHHAALISFVDGQSAQTTLSFQHALPRNGFVEINGSEGTIVLPDPNVFDGESTLWTLGKDEPTTLAHKGSTWGRGTGVVELARAIAEGRPERASGAVASHALDVMLGIRDAAESGQAVEVTSRITKPEPLPEDFDPSAAVLAEGVNA
ncbi:Gfo/Idh/MocA family protein [Curtobacterium sp. MCBA15_001]|uniref:Gfo/Idh/MocA family protein n=1 Tax=Curtobacterium sp. MCBA15_001 TaxID=1898731 RepID=UPI0008DD7CF4|nr:Gfo/Idh/MocA family oxidoreductase [Curtobacterium sp. MCBA15_001]OIH92283.1 oxidoreductase [Curtobacterium sp. MCBA15_001]